jgi:hypothetical protein
MIKLITALAVLSLALIGLNCKDDEETSAIPEKYIGTWKASATVPGTLIQYAPASAPENGVDVRLLGGEITVTLNKDATYSLIFKDPVEGEDTDAGKVSLDEDNKLISMDSNDPDTDPLIFQYEWDDDNTLILTTQAEFDFGNGAVPAIVTIIIKRQ